MAVVPKIRERIRSKRKAFVRPSQENVLLLQQFSLDGSDFTGVSRLWQRSEVTYGFLDKSIRADATQSLSKVISTLFKTISCMEE